MNSDHAARIPVGFVSFFAILFICLLSACRNDIAEIRAITEFKDLPIQTNLNAEYVYTENGKLKNKIIASQLDQYDDDKSTTVAHGGFVLVFYDSLEKEEARLSGTKGTYNQKDKKLVADGNVILLNIKGEKLETEQLIFDQDSASIYTDKYVKISTRSGDIFGKGLVSNESFTRYRILEPTGDINMEKPDSTSAE